MARSKIYIPVQELERLYIQDGLSPIKIGLKYNCDAVTVRTRIREAGIPLKSKSLAQTKYFRTDFSGSDTEKAYILGFRYGDLNVYKPKGASETIVVRSHTTQKVQTDLFTSLFNKYGKVVSSKGITSTHSNCYLNNSFSFMLDKYPLDIRTWLQNTPTLYWSFGAGYIDAEGTFGLNQGRGRFKIDAYDYAILLDLHTFFQEKGIRSKFRVIAYKGNDDYGWKWKEDLWRLSVNEAGSLERLIQNLKPFLSHKKRVEDAEIVFKNIQERRAHGTIK